MHPCLTHLEFFRRLALGPHLTPSAPPPEILCSFNTPSLHPPCPDLGFGYPVVARFGDRDKHPFTNRQLDTGEFGLGAYEGERFVHANIFGMRFPFFVAQITADDSSEAVSLWAAVNRAAGEAGTCLNTSERLNEALADAVAAEESSVGENVNEGA
ncbi:hypothetical protein C8A05DRAFT_40047 [Staphylotrichum tortipilum]|uniref:Uncharacterized protein n=1 Tax=Staphylotrichum tortipilum TaxID=2831512 RepID=A0AAN6RNJ7_9PEZI|nr:hypothetical protein C8A05DRAFT_40047 [Staphylotrichum longicolle]